MSVFVRLRSLPATRRSYSSFFSSRSGGGRYFNSSKAPKNAVVAAKNAPKPEPQELQQDSTASSSSQATQSTMDTASSAQSGVSSSPAASTPPTTSPTISQLAQQAYAAPQQFALNAEDYKMHQFFSLHRPLLLASDPSSLFRPVQPHQPLFRADAASEGASPARIFSEWPQSSMSPMDADAEAARQLTRALTMSKAGASIAWEDTLRHLGLDVSKGADRVGLEELLAKEKHDVLMDSTKRKRRKKMKKHKLKKRRRATRSERLRLK